MFRGLAMSKGSSRYYLIIFSYILLVISLTILVLSSFFYINFESIITNQAYTYINHNLDEFSSNIDRINSSVEKIGVQMSTDVALKPFFIDLPLEYNTLIPGLRQLDNYRFLSTDATSIYLYNDANETFYISADRLRNAVRERSSFYDNDSIAAVNSQSHSFSGPIPRKIPVEEIDGRLTHYYGYTYIFNQYINIAARNGMVVVNVSGKNLSQMIIHQNKTFGSQTIVIDSVGRLMAGAGDLEILSDLSQEGYIQKILSYDGSEDNYFLDTVGGQYSCVTFTPADKNGWRCINITPYQNIMNETIALRRKFTMIGFGFFLVGALLSIVISWRLYSPVKILEQNLKKLQSENRNSHLRLKREFLQTLIVHTHACSAQDLHGDLQKYELSCLENSKIMIGLLKIDNYKQLSLDVVRDLTLYKFAIGNIISELIPSCYCVQSVDMGDDCIALILCIEDDFDYFSLKEQLTESVLDTQLACDHHLKMSFSAFFSTVGDSVALAPFLYNQAKQISIYRLFKGAMCTLFSYDLLNNGQQSDYPSVKHKQLTDALMMGNIEEAKQCYLEIVDVFSALSPHAFSHSFSHLIYSISMAIDTIQRKNFPTIPITYNLSFSLTDFETMQQVNEQLFAALDNLAELMDNKRSIKYDELIAKIYEIIDEGYLDSNFSINQIADSLNLSANYLGRLFKKYTSESIPEHIMQLRMKKGKELLATTSLSVAQISEKIGFTNDGYFYKAFKKAHGITPVEYRRAVNG